MKWSGNLPTQSICTGNSFFMMTSRSTCTTEGVTSLRTIPGGRKMLSRVIAKVLGPTLELVRSNLTCTWSGLMDFISAPDPSNSRLTEKMAAATTISFSLINSRPFFDATPLCSCKICSNLRFCLTTVSRPSRAATTSPLSSDTTIIRASLTSANPRAAR